METALHWDTVWLIRVWGGDCGVILTEKQVWRLHWDTVWLIRVWGGDCGVILTEKQVWRLHWDTVWLIRVWGGRVVTVVSLLRNRYGGCTALGYSVADQGVEW